MKYFIIVGDEHIYFDSYEEAYNFCEDRHINPDSINSVSRKVSVLPTGTRTKILKLNEVGLSNLRTYYINNYPKRNFSRYIEIIRTVAKNGYKYTESKYHISYESMRKVLADMYKVALKIEEEEKAVV